MTLGDYVRDQPETSFSVEESQIDAMVEQMKRMAERDAAYRVSPSETMMVRQARRVIFEAMSAEKAWDFQKVDLAKWVIENIWTPDAEKAA